MKNTNAKNIIRLALLGVVVLMAILVLVLSVVTESESATEAYALESVYNADISAINEEGGYVDYNTTATSYEEKAPMLASADGKRYIYNLVIYICFAGDDESVLTSNPCYDMLSGDDKSLYDYYNDVSYGKVVITSLYPQDGGLVAVYKAPNSRNSYQVLDGKANRANVEKGLLESALNAVGSKFNLNGVDLDANDDGYVDAVSFLISGSSSGSWGSLLWPHSWNLQTILGDYDFNGVKVGDYSFNFVNNLTLGVTCHEFFHVLGAPDLYHYDYDFVPVGNWDLMQFDDDMPQYSLVFMRQKYLQAIDDSQISTITHNGVYSLKPVTIAGENEVIAFKIPTNKSDETIWVEYRNPGLSDGYDSTLPGAGLIIYRVKDGVTEGNRNANYKSTYKPDEVYIYRPDTAGISKATTKSQRYSCSRKDIAYAYLSPNNSVFSSVGATLAEKPTTKTADRYDYTTLYYVDGTNTGIIIEAVSISSGSIEFRVKLNKDSGVDDEYFKEKVAIGSATYVNTNEFSGVEVKVNTANAMDTTYMGDMYVTLLTSDGDVVAKNTLSLNKFRESYAAGERIFTCRFIVSDKGSVLQSVFNSGAFDTTKTPAKVSLVVVDSDGDEIDLETQEIATDEVTWATILATQSELSAGIVCGDRATFGVRKDGTVVCAGDCYGGQWSIGGMTNITAVASGLTHTLFLKKDLTVSSSYAQDYYGENAVLEWSDIVMVAAGHYTSYGLTASGKVLAVGRNNSGQLSVAKWVNIAYIAAGESFVIGISRAGVVYTAGDNTYGQLSTTGVSDVTEVACGNTFAAYLSDGRVIVKGSLVGSGEVGLWNNIVKIAAGKNVLLGLKSDGTVVAAGDNSYGQLNVSDLIDIEDLDAGEYHTAFMRLDGVVEFRGIGLDECKTNGELTNLKYDNYINVTAIAVSADLTTAFENETINLAAGIMPLDATYKRLIYTSSDTSVATVSQSGVVSCIGAGTAVIYVKSHGSGVMGSIEITVRKYVELTGIGFASAKVTLLVGKSTELVPVFYPSDATMDNWELSYTSDFANRVTVTSTGLVTGNQYCESTITLTAYNKATGKTLTATCAVSVITGIDRIELVASTAPVDCYYGEELDVSGMRFVVVTKSGEEDVYSSPMLATSSMLSGYNKTPSFGEEHNIKQTVTVNYMDKSVTFEVVTRDFVSSVRIYNMPKQKFIYGEAFSIGEGGQLERTYASGATVCTIMESGETDPSAYNSTMPGIYEIIVKVQSKKINGTVTYVSTLYNVQVQDTVMQVESMLINKSYNFGEEIDANEQLKLIMHSGAVRTVTFGDATITGFNNTKIGTHNIDIEYYDAVGDATYKTSDTVTVDLVGTVDFGSYNIGDDSPDAQNTNYIYFYIGEALPITVSVIAGQKTFVLGMNSETTDGIYYELDDFDNTKLNPGTTTIKIYVNTTSGYREYYVRGLNVFGVKEESSIELVGINTTYNYGEAITGVKYKIKYKDSTEGEWALEDGDIIYDPELVGVEQIVQFRYLNDTLKITKKIIINDVMVGLQDIKDMTTVFGNAIDLKVYKIMKKGGAEELAPATSSMVDGYTVSDYSVSDVSKINAQQRITVSYGGWSTSFNLTVYDELVAIEMLSGVQSTFKYGASFSALSLYTVTYKSGIIETIAYNDKDFVCSPTPNMTKLGRQTFVIYYRPLGEEFLATIYVVNYVKELIPESGYKNSYKYGEDLDISITAVYADGSTATIKATDCTSNYNSINPTTQYVSLKYDGCTVVITVSVSDGVKALSWITSPGYTAFKYGEALNLPGAVLQVEYENGEPEIYRSKAILSNKNFEISYDPTKAGKQLITITFEGKSVSFTVDVERESVNTLTFAETEELFKDKSGSKLISLSTATIREIALHFVAIDYLTVTVTDKTGTQIPISDETMQSGYSVTVINENSQIIYQFAYVLRGDADGDGTLTSADIKLLADMYVSGSADKVLTDSDSDGTFSLTDLINLARKATDNAKTPLNDAAKEFISDVKCRKQKEEEVNEKA